MKSIKLITALLSIRKHREKNERDTAYRLALEFICNLTDNMLLAGLYMALPTAETELHKSF